MSRPPRRRTAALEPAVFLDRDGTLTEPRAYPSHPSHLVLNTGVGPRLRALQEAGVLLIVVTNQSGVARGYFDESDLGAMHDHLHALLAEFDVRLDGVYFCPHHPDGKVPHLAVRCDCRKPEPGMLLKAAAELGADLDRSWMIGDMESDVLAGESAGCTSFLVNNDPKRAEPQQRFSDGVLTTAGALSHIYRAVTGRREIDGSCPEPRTDRRRVPVHRLADGREIRFYDDPGTSHRPCADSRRLAPVESHSELRWDPLLQDWVIMAPNRRARSDGAAETCPLCLSAGGGHSEIPASGYDVAVFENRYPALSGVPGAVPHAPRALTRSPAPGRCEVIAYSSDHEARLSDLPVVRVRTVLEAMADRTVSLNAADGVRQVVCFENHGAQVGASLAHPHGQVYGYPFLPRRFARMREVALEAHRRGEGCPVCIVVQQELDMNERLVARTERWAAVVPFAARWPYEVHVYPLRHVPELAALTEVETEELAHLYRTVLGCFADVAEEALPYLATWVQAPAGKGPDDVTHLHVQVFSDRASPSRIKKSAAGELGAGAFVSEADPEAMAKALSSAARPSELIDISWRNT
ncbi:galactose-1-phosphate uridylyltransferase [Streptomyces sp. NPDC058092]|uniref:galactose-1-phosphate uridylyltransferase n=1 Tax=Streptomyces sp. NPDC058092 TaxID=3346336 RepID=UPI0036E1225B